ncbi:MAG: hypothetical protein FWC80_00210 [Firmicutes bacterium]|nr:hypothetical protein [Bacillota bacterium]
MLDTIKKYISEYSTISHESKTVILFAYPYIPYKNLTIDAYYVASQECYNLTKTIIAELGKAGIASEAGRNLPLQELAIKSGLAYKKGKNGLAYHKKYGSRFCIGAIVLQSDEKIEDTVLGVPLCNPDCILCIKACPNGAITQTKVNYSKCLRHLANDPKSMTSAQIKMLGGRVLGCDICQRACPQNKTEYIDMPPDLSDICHDLTSPANIKKLSNLIGKNMTRIPRELTRTVKL